jgi:hypothetical protein
VVNEKVFREMQCRVPLESGDELKAAFVSRMLKEAAFVLRDWGQKVTSTDFAPCRRTGSKEEQFSGTRCLRAQEHESYARLKPGQNGNQANGAAVRQGVALCQVSL